MGQLQKKDESVSSALLGGAATLGAAAIISKLLGTLQKIPLQNIAGDEAFGIYSAVYPFYTLILFLATAGIPVAVSKMVSERIAAGNAAETITIFRIAQTLLAILGVLFFFLLFFGAKQIAAWIGNAYTFRALQSVAFALLIVPFMAVYRGYFQGLQQMLPTAVSQVVEQVVRVGTMVLLIIVFTYQGYSADWIAAGATFGAVTGALAGLIAVLIYWQQKSHRSLLKKWSRDEREINTSRAKLLKQLMWLALPICLGAVVVPVLNIVDTFTVPRWVSSESGSEQAAIEQFGIYSRGLPLVQLLAMLVSSISVAIVPAFAEAFIKRKVTPLRIQTEFIVRLTWLIGIGASVGLAFCAVPINIMLYTNELGSETMAILAFTGVFSMVNIVTASMLQGIGYANVSAFNLLWAAIVKLLLNIWWVPLYGINGAAASAVIAFLIASILNSFVLYKKVRFNIKLGHYIWRPALSLFCMVFILWIINVGIGERLGLLESGRIGAAVTALLAVVFGAIVYVLSLFWFRSISYEDLKRFPELYRKLSPVLRLIGLSKFKD